MGRYDQDPTALVEGDDAFVGYASRRPSTRLTKGLLERSQNMRLDRLTCKPRKGLKLITTDITLTNPPVVFDYVFGVDVPVASITRAGATATVTTLAPHLYTSGDQVNIRDANQTEYNGDKIIAVTDVFTFTYTVIGTPATPATGTIFANKGPILFEDYASQVRSSCVFATADHERTEYVIIASTQRAYACRFGVSTTVIDYPADERVVDSDECSMLQWNGKIYLFRGYQTADPFSVTLTQAAGLATATSLTPHGRTTGQWVTIAGAAQPAYNGVFQITVTGPNTFTFAVLPAAVSPATGTITARPSKIPLQWDGNLANDFVPVPSGAVAASGTTIRMPCVAWGQDFRNRLWLPYQADELLGSDPLDATVYDLAFYSIFRIRPGSNDWLVGVHPFQEGNFLVFYAKSLHLLALDAATLDLARADELTRDVGCAARESIVTCGGSIVWLSTSGIYRLRTTDQVKLVAEQLPLSDDVQDAFDRINWAYAHKVRATFFNNRYYIALPLDAVTIASTVLVYNFLNGQWETTDIYPTGFDVERFHLLDYKGAKRLYCTSTVGYLILLEENEQDEWGTPGSVVTYHIPGVIYSRYYTAGSLEPKKARRATLEADMDTGDEFTAQVVTRLPARAGAVKTVTRDGADAEGLYRVPAGSLNGSAAQLRVVTTKGRPEIRFVLMEFAGDRERHNHPLTT